jgi:hypothetical protein
MRPNLYSVRHSVTYMSRKRSKWHDQQPLPGMGDVEQPTLPCREPNYRFPVAEKFEPQWLAPHVGYITYWLLRGTSKEDVKHMLSRARGYADVTDSEFETVYLRALTDARASIAAARCQPGTKIGDCYK